MTLNKGVLRETIEAVKTAPDFRMDRVFHPCGTPSCIAGHVLSTTGWIPTKRAYAIERARCLLGLATDVAYELFAPVLDDAHFRHGPGNPGHVTKAHAVKCLQRLLATGEVDWAGARERS